MFNIKITKMEASVITYNDIPSVLGVLVQKVEKLESLLERINVGDQKEPVKWFNAEELSKYLPDKPAVKTIYEWTWLKKIPFHKKGRKLQFKKSEIDEWLDGDRRKTHAEIKAEAIKDSQKRRVI